MNKIDSYLHKLIRQPRFYGVPIGTSTNPQSGSPTFDTQWVCLQVPSTAATHPHQSGHVHRESAVPSYVDYHQPRNRNSTCLWWSLCRGPRIYPSSWSWLHYADGRFSTLSPRCLHAPFCVASNPQRLTQGRRSSGTRWAIFPKARWVWRRQGWDYTRRWPR